MSHDAIISDLIWALAVNPPSSQRAQEIRTRVKNIFSGGSITIQQGRIIGELGSVLHGTSAPEESRKLAETLLALLEEKYHNSLAGRVLRNE